MTTKHPSWHRGFGFHACACFLAVSGITGILAAFGNESVDTAILGAIMLLSAFAAWACAWLVRIWHAITDNKE